MKSKNKFNINVIIISLIIGFSIYLLYFNDKIYIQDTIMNSLHKKGNKINDDSLIENFDVNKYLDICKNRNTHFYNLAPASGNVFLNSNIDDCEKKCNDISCHAFALNNTTCSIYKGALNSSTNSDNRNSTTNLIQINCDDRQLPNNNPYTTKTYNGIGYMNKVYFQNNKNSLEYIDPYLNESVTVLGNLYSIENKRNQLDSLSPSANNYGISYDAIRQDMMNKNSALFRKFDTINTNLFDNSKNKLYTDMYNNTDISNSILAPSRRDISFINYVDDKYNIAKKSESLNGLLDAISENFMSNNVRYLILTFIMVITIIILILYKSSNSIINEKILILYIVFITFLVLFITHHLKI